MAFFSPVYYLNVCDFHELDTVLGLGCQGVHAVAGHPGVNLERGAQFEISRLRCRLLERDK